MNAHVDVEATAAARQRFAEIRAARHGTTPLLDRHDLARIFDVSPRGLDSRVRLEMEAHGRPGGYPADRVPLVPLPDIHIGTEVMPRRLWSARVVEVFLDEVGVAPPQHNARVRFPAPAEDSDTSAGGV